MKNVAKTIKQQEEDIKKEEVKRVRNFIKSRKEPRKTIQVRISRKWHDKLKEERLIAKKPLSRIMDRILGNYFK